jgi:hypothetical protein
MLRLHGGCGNWCTVPDMTTCQTKHSRMDAQEYAGAQKLCPCYACICVWSSVPQHWALTAEKIQPKLQLQLCAFDALT